MRQFTRHNASNPVEGLFLPRLLLLPSHPLFLSLSLSFSFSYLPFDRRSSTSRRTLQLRERLPLYNAISSPVHCRIVVDLASESRNGSLLHVHLSRLVDYEKILFLHNRSFRDRCYEDRCVHTWLKIVSKGNVKKGMMLLQRNDLVLRT